MVRVPPAPTTVDRLQAADRLTLRDDLLLSWLAEHYVLTTSQISAALFPSLRAAQERLTLLYRIGAVTRRRYDPSPADAVLYRIGALPRYQLGTPEIDPGDYRYSLGPLGVLLQPVAYHDPDDLGAKPPKSHIERSVRIGRSHIRRHLMGVNRFFTDLYAHARTHPEARLTHWWSEQHCIQAFESRHQIRPDGHGVWQVGDATVGLFLEYDNDTESVLEVVKKIGRYEDCAVQSQGPRWPVLLWVPTRARERSLQHTLAGTTLPFTVATAVHSRTPGEAVWASTERPDTRVHLHELPSGPISGFHRVDGDPDPSGGPADHGDTSTG